MTPTAKLLLLLAVCTAPCAILQSAALPTIYEERADDADKSVPTWRAADTTEEERFEHWCISATEEERELTLYSLVKHNGPSADIQRLLKLGVNPGTPTAINDADRLYTPLHWAVVNSRIDLILLIDAYVPGDSYNKDKLGRTPLELAQALESRISIKALNQAQQAKKKARRAEQASQLPSLTCPGYEVGVDTDSDEDTKRPVRRGVLDKTDT